MIFLIRTCWPTTKRAGAWAGRSKLPRVRILSTSDAVAIDQGDNPQWLYTVVFDGTELWGPDADPTSKISIDAFEPYLEPA